MSQLTKAQLKTWVKALRSGKFKQGKGVLYDEEKNTYCCLGVAARVCLKKTPKQILNIASKHDELLSPKVLDYAGQCYLSKMNDGYEQPRKSFAGIATWIEKNLINAKK